jgi:hypothetical protein
MLFPKAADDAEDIILSASPSVSFVPKEPSCSTTRVSFGISPEW